MYLFRESIYVLMIGIAVLFVFVIFRSKKNKCIERTNSVSYEISKRKYAKFEDISNSVIINTTLTFSNEDEIAVFEDDRGYAGYENVVFKGVSLLKEEGFKIPSLEGHADV